MWKDVDPSSERQFQADLDALHRADTCLLVLPCGRSAHTEAGWMKGAGSRTDVQTLRPVSGNLEEVNEYLDRMY